MRSVMLQINEYDDADDDDDDDGLLRYLNGGSQIDSFLVDSCTVFYLCSKTAADVSLAVVIVTLCYGQCIIIIHKSAFR